MRHENQNKAAVIESVDSHFEALRSLSDRIWSYEEIAFQEEKSAKDLSDFAEQQGFKVTRNIGDIPTAFTAEYGSGSPGRNATLKREGFFVHGSKVSTCFANEYLFLFFANNFPGRATK